MVRQTANERHAAFNAKVEAMIQYNGNHNAHGWESARAFCDECEIAFPWNYAVYARNRASRHLQEEHGMKP